MELAVPGVKSLAPKANCSICFESYNNNNRLPKIICPMGHTICLICLDKILNSDQSVTPKCPLCQRDLPRADASVFPSNYALLDVLIAFDQSEERFLLGQAKCSECNSSGAESMFWVCIPCAKTKGIFCDVESVDFDWEQLDAVTICAGCILKKHKGPFHSRIKLLKLRTSRDRRDMEKLVTGAEQRMAACVAACHNANNLSSAAVKQLHEMVALTSNVDSSVVLKDTKEFIKEANTSLVDIAISMRKACAKYERDLKAHVERDLKKKKELALHCKPEEEEVEEEHKEEIKEQPPAPSVTSDLQTTNSDLESSMVNQDVALSQMGLAIALSTCAMIVFPLLQSQWVWDSVSALMSFFFWMFGFIFNVFAGAK